MSSSLPIVAILGATGHQGGSVLRSLAATGKYQIRALTRNPEDEKAKKLLSEGKSNNIELVKCNADIPAELESAFKGAWAVFAVTNYWVPEIMKNPELEIIQGKKIVDAADSVGVKYFVWSSLANANKESNGKLKVPHFDNKNIIEEYAKSKSNIKSIFFYASTYYQNLLFFFVPQKQADGSLLFSMPIKADAKMHWYDVTETGPIVAKVLESPEQYINKDISSTGSELTLADISAQFTEVTGVKSTYKSLTEAEYKAVMPDYMFEDCFNMFQWFEQFGYYGQRNPFVARDELKLKQNSFRDWLKSSGYKGPQ